MLLYISKSVESLCRDGADMSNVWVHREAFLICKQSHSRPFCAPSSPLPPFLDPMIPPSRQKASLDLLPENSCKVGLSFCLLRDIVKTHFLKTAWLITVVLSPVHCNHYQEGSCTNDILVPSQMGRIYKPHTTSPYLEAILKYTNCKHMRVSLTKWSHACIFLAHYT